MKKKFELIVNKESHFVWAYSLEQAKLILLKKGIISTITDIKEK